MSHLHPQAHLTAGGPASNPVLAAVEHSHCRNGGDTVAPELGKLISRVAVDVDKAVHVSNAEALNP